ncbi:MAG TPA: hypothetical protein VHL53_10885 [Acidimicrobiia bacterium]|nr:hypothetical protein [Acidimicrobiia bacterium]
MKPRRLAIYGLTAGLLGGGAAGLAMTGSTLSATRIADVTSPADSPAAAGAGAASTDSTAAGSSDATTPTGPAASDPSTTTTTPAAGGAAGAPAPGRDWLKAALDPLVKNGTITQAQEDAALAALKAALPDHGGPGGPGGPGGFGHGGPGHGGPGHGADLDAAAKALGMSADELRTALDSGKSLADVAKDKGVAVSKIIDALVADMKSHLDADVAAGRLTRAQADEMLANCRSRLTDVVNGKAPAGGPGGPGGRWPGFGRPGGGFGGPGRPGGGGAPANGAPANGAAPATGSAASPSTGTVTS